MLSILYEDNHLLAVNKPAGIATMGVPEGRPSLIGLAKEYVKEKYNKPGNVYLGVVSRLDYPVSGVLLFARTSKAAARLTEQFRGRDVGKVYWAAVSGTPRPAAGRCVGWIRKDERHRKVHISDAPSEGAQEATLTYRTLERGEGISLVEVTLETGRKHQIRIQLSHLGHPIVGDRKYASGESFPAGIALHARKLALLHPVRKTPLEIVAALPKAWTALGLSVEGGS